jgi:hypothetical protein
MAAVVVAGLARSGCDKNSTDAAQGPLISYAPREPGSTAAPTNETSFALISADGPVRLATLQAIIAQDGNQCSYVTSGIFKTGFDGSDEWLVTCADSGSWAIWFRPQRQLEVLSCSISDCP